MTHHHHSSIPWLIVVSRGGVGTSLVPILGLRQTPDVWPHRTPASLYLPFPVHVVVNWRCSFFYVPYVSRRKTYVWSLIFSNFNITYCTFTAYTRPPGPQFLSLSLPLPVHVVVNWWRSSFFHATSSFHPVFCCSVRLFSSTFFFIPYSSNRYRYVDFVYFIYTGLLQHLCQFCTATVAVSILPITSTVHI